MAELFNLSVRDYNINELKDLLNLMDPFTLEDIVHNENILREKLLIDKNVSKGKKKEIIKFLSEVKKILIKDTKKRVFKYAPQDYLMGDNHAITTVRGGVSSHINPVPRDEATESGTSKHTIHRLLCLDTRFRSNYYTTLSTDYTFTLPTVVKKVISMELSALEFPSTYYQVSKSLGNNYFWLGWTDPRRIHASHEPIVLWYYIAIPDGNYLREDIETAINEQIQIAVQPTTVLDAFVCYPQCKIDEHSVKTVISIKPGNTGNGDLDHPPDETALFIYFNRSRGENFGGSTPSDGPYSGDDGGGGVDIPPGLDLGGFSGVVGNFGWILGYRLGEYEGSWAYVSEGCYDAWGTKYIYIVVNDFNKSVNNFVVPSYNESIGKSNILARISTESAGSSTFSQGLSLTNDTLTNDSSIKKRFYFGPVDISRMQLQVLDEFGRVVNLNNMDYSLALNLVCLYD